MFDLILGRGSSAIQGLHVFPGINAYTGEIKIVATASQGPITILLGQ